MPKAQTQFNWIFVLIAGVIFLAFFITIAMKYRDIQEEKTHIELLNNLDIAITSLQSSPFKTTTKINIPVETQLLCNNNKLYLKIAERQYETQNIIASQEKIKNKIIISSNQLNLPFKIATLYYLLPEAKKYVFVYDEESKEQIEEIKQDLSLLENIEYKQSPIKEDPAKDYIYLTQSAKSKIQVTPTSILLPNKQPLPYYNNYHLYALIFSSQPECLSSLIDSQLKQKTQIYIDKIPFLQSSQGCDYSLINNQLQQFPQNPSKSNQELLIELNKQIINKNCPAVF